MTNRRGRLLVLGGVFYLLFLGGLVGTLVVVRNRVLHPARQSAAQRNWEAWRKKAGDEVRRNPATRRQVPRSPEPPAVVLLRDHFGLCMTAALIFGSALFGSFWLFLYGTLTTGSRAS